jgi:hypothetical protein
MLIEHLTFTMIRTTLIIQRHTQSEVVLLFGISLANPAKIPYQSYSYGKWNAESLWRVIGQSHQAGDSQLTVFDLENQIMLASFS